MKRKKNIAVVHCSGGAKQNEGIDFAALPKDCNQILEQYPDGIHSCSYGCLGGGSCVAACKLHALTINEKGVAEVDRDQCVGCGLCVKACPKHLIELVPYEQTTFVQCSSHAKGKAVTSACEVGCIGCKKCEKTCPNGAITVDNFCAHIDYSKCTNCGACKEVCPRHIIQ